MDIDYYDNFKFNSTLRKVKEIRKEEITIGGKPRIVHREFVRYNSKFMGVGLIVDKDINNCMICNAEFGILLHKHHCRCCGNLVCDTCSPSCVEIYEMRKLGPQRVCNQCYWGQVLIIVIELTYSIRFVLMNQIL